MGRLFVLQVIDQVVRLFPIAFSIVPQGFQLAGKAKGRRVVFQGFCESVDVHIKFAGYKDNGFGAFTQRCRYGSSPNLLAPRLPPASELRLNRICTWFVLRLDLVWNRQ